MPTIKLTNLPVSESVPESESLLLSLPPTEIRMIICVTYKMVIIVRLSAHSCNKLNNEPATDA